MITFKATIDGAKWVAQGSDFPTFVIELVGDPDYVAVVATGAPRPARWADDELYGVSILSHPADYLAVPLAEVGYPPRDPDAALVLLTFSDDDNVTDPTVLGDWVTTGVITPDELLRATVPPGHLNVLYALWPDGTVDTLRDTGEAEGIAEGVLATTARSSALRALPATP